MQNDNVVSQYKNKSIKKLCFVKKITSTHFTYWEAATGVWRLVLGACAARFPERPDDRPPAAQRRAG